MAKQKIRRKDLIKLGYPKGKTIDLAIDSFYKHHRREGKEWGLAILQNLLKHPKQFLEDEAFSRVG